MDLKVIVSLGLIAVLGFLIYPRDESQKASIEDYEWITLTNPLDNEPLHGTKLRKDNPVVKTYDLGYIYRIDRAEVLFDGSPKDYDLLISSDGDEYRRAVSASLSSREYYYSVITFPPKEAKRIQIVVNDWYGTQPKIQSARVGARYSRYNPVRNIRTKYNPGEAFRLVDGLKHEDAPKWPGGKRIEREVEKDKKPVIEVTYESPGRSNVEVLFDLGIPKNIYGIAVTTGGNENNLKQYRISTSLDGRSYQQVYVSKELENKTVTDSHIFARENPEAIIRVRFIRLTISPNGWYGKYPEIREVEIFTDEYRPSDYTKPIENYNAFQVSYNDCGINGSAQSPVVIQGFPFDRGERLEPKDRYYLKPGEEVDLQNTESERSFCYHYDRVTYSYSDIDPAAMYWIQVTYLQEKNGKRVQNLDVDGFLLHDSMEIPAGIAKKFIFAIPPETYADREIKLRFNRVAGPNAIVSDVLILQASKEDMMAREQLYSGVFAKGPMATAKVVIDGVLNEWPDIFPMVPQQYSGDPLSSPCYMYTQWDSENLYLAFKVNRDRLPIAAANSKTQSPDILHVFVDTGLTQSQGMYETGDHHFRFSPLGVSASEKRVLVSQMHHYQDAIPTTMEDRKDIEAVARIIPREKTAEYAMEYVMEARIPKDKVLYGFSPRPGSLIGFNYVLSNSSTKAVSWSNASIAAPPASWGQLELVGTVKSQIAVVPLNPPESIGEMAKYSLKEFMGKALNFSAGQDLLLAVWDPDQNTDRDSRQSIKVSVKGDLSGDSKEVVLSETPQDMKIEADIPPSNNSDLFAGSISTEYGTTPSSDPHTLSVQGNELVTIYYLDPYYGPNQRNVEISATAKARVGTTGAISILSEAGTEINSFNAGDRLFLKVEDSDLLQDAKQISVTVVSNTDTEKVILVSEKDTGIFKGSVETAFRNTGSPDGILQVVGGETIKAEYLDSIQAAGKTNVLVEASARVNTGSTGILIVGKSETGRMDDFVIVKNFNAGEDLLVFLRDSDVNTDRGIVEQAEVWIAGNTVNDNVTLTLKETEPDSDTFSANLNTVYSLMADRSNNMLEVKGGETVTITYKDALQNNGATGVPVSETVRVNIGNNGTISIVQSNFLWELEDFNAGDTIYFKVEDADLNYNPGAKDRMSISAVSEETHDSEMITLEEMSASAGVFLGSLVTKYSDTPDVGDKILQVRGNEKVTALYLDKLQATGETNVPVTDSCRVNTGSKGKITIYSKSHPDTPIAGFPDEGWINRFKAGETLIIRLEDMDLNLASAAADISQVKTTEDMINDSVSVNLTEVRGSAGIFAGEVKTEYGTSAIPGDGILQVQGEGQVSIGYIDAITDTGETDIPITVSLKVETGHLGAFQVMNAEGTSSISSLNAGDAFIIRLRDEDLNITPGAADRAIITAKGNLLEDQLQIVLQEISGMFEGRVQTAHASSPDLQDTVLQVKEKEIVSLTYIDAVVATGKTDVPVSTDLIVRSGSAGSLLIVDENGRELLNFNAGRRLYFLLDDFIFSNTSPGSGAHITIQGNGTKDTEVVTLEEKSDERGIYLGFIPTNYGTIPVQDGILQVRGGEEVKAIYYPQTPAPPLEPITDATYTNKGSDGKITILSANGFKLNNFNAGDTLYLKLEDPDLNFSASVIDKAEIWVSGDAIASGRAIKLNETGEDSGIFTGSIGTRFGRGMPGSSDVLEVIGGENVSAVYYDAITSSGETDVKVTDSCKANMIGTATYARESVIIDGSMAGWPLENSLRAGDEGSNLYVQWDKDNLYILAYVIDPEVVVPDATKFWEGADALEIHIDTDPSGENSAYLRGLKKPSYYFFWFCPKGAGPDGNMPYVGQNMPETVYDYIVIQTAVRIFPGSRYVLEARIPLDPVLGGFDPYRTSKADRIGFNYIIRRSSGPQLRWAISSESEPSVPPSAFGTLILNQP